MRVMIYYNLNRYVWSIRALEGPYKGLVIAHAKQVILSGGVPKVCESMRQRSIQQQRRSLHAGLQGELVYWQADPRTPTVSGRTADALRQNTRWPAKAAKLLETATTHGQRVTYRPFKAGYFMNPETEQPIALQQWTVFCADRKTYTCDGL